MILASPIFPDSGTFTQDYYLDIVRDEWVVYPSDADVLFRTLGDNDYTTYPDGYISWEALTFLQDYYFNIVITPARENVGSISSNITRTVLVWSSFLTNNNLQSVSVSGNDTGILTGFTTDTFAPLEERSYQVQVTMDGPASFDVDYLLDFEDGQGLYNILGNRIVVFTFKPNWKEGITEVYEYLTSVDSAYSGKEERESVRNNARRFMEYQTHAYQSQVEQFDQLLWANQGRDIGVPLWQHSDYFDLLPEGTTEVNLDTTDKGYLDSVVFVDEDGENLVLEIATISSTQIGLSQPLPRDFRGVTVSPLRQTYLGDNVRTERLTSNLLRNRANIEVVNHEAWIGEFTATQLFNTKPVWLKFPNRESRNNFSYETDYFSFDNDAGSVKRKSKNDVVRSNRSYDFVFNGRENIYDFHKFFNWTKGKVESFYMPLWERSMKVVEDITQGDNSITVDFLNYEASYDPFENRNAVAIYVIDEDEWLLRNITAFGENGTTDLSLDDPFAKDYSKDNIIVHFLEKVRFGSDRVEMTWRKNNLLETSINFVSVVE